MADVARNQPTRNGAIRLTVRVKPRAKTSRILRVNGPSLEVSLARPPVDGAANEELVALLAKTLGVPKRSCRLVLGAASKTKVVEVVGLDATDVTLRLSAHA
jgi:uncharacterized protein